MLRCASRRVVGTVVCPPALQALRSYSNAKTNNLVPPGENVSRFQSSPVGSERRAHVRNLILMPHATSRLTATTLGCNVRLRWQLAPIRAALPGVIADMLRIDPAHVALGLSRGAGRRHARDEAVMDLLPGRSCDVRPEWLIPVHLDERHYTTTELVDLGFALYEGVMAKGGYGPLLELGVSYAEPPTVDAEADVDTLFGKELDEDEAQRVTQQWEEGKAAAEGAGASS